MGETATDFIFLDSKITVDSDYSHEIKRLLLLGKKAMTNLDNLLKSRDITLPAKVRLVKDGFPSIRVFSNDSVLCIMWPKYWSFSISPSNDYSGLISFRMDWFQTGEGVLQGYIVTLLI